MASKVARRLSVCERELVELHVVKGLPQYKAFLQAFRHITGNWNASSHDAKCAMATTRATTIMRKPYIQEYVEELKNKLADRAQQSMFLSLDEKRKFLADVVRTPVEDIDESSHLAQEVKYKPDGSIEIKTPDKQRAIELDSRLMGEFNDTLRLDISEKVLDFTKDVR